MATRPLRWFAIAAATCASCAPAPHAPRTAPPPAPPSACTPCQDLGCALAALPAPARIEVNLHWRDDHPAQLVFADPLTGADAVYPICAPIAGDDERSTCTTLEGTYDVYAIALEPSADGFSSVTRQAKVATRLAIHDGDVLSFSVTGGEVFIPDLGGRALRLAIKDAESGRHMGVEELVDGRAQVMTGTYDFALVSTLPFNPLAPAPVPIAQARAVAPGTAEIHIGALVRDLELRCDVVSPPDVVIEGCAIEGDALTTGSAANGATVSTVVGLAAFDVVATGTQLSTSRSVSFRLAHVDAGDDALVMDERFTPIDVRVDVDDGLLLRSATLRDGTTLISSAGDDGLLVTMPVEDVELTAQLWGSDGLGQVSVVHVQELAADFVIHIHVEPTTIVGAFPVPRPNSTVPWLLEVKHPDFTALTGEGEAAHVWGGPVQVFATFGDNGDYADVRVGTDTLLDGGTFTPTFAIVPLSVPADLVGALFAGEDPATGTNFAVRAEADGTLLVPAGRYRALSVSLPAQPGEPVVVAAPVAHCLELAVDDAP